MRKEKFVKSALFSTIIFLFLLGCNKQSANNDKILKQAFELSDTLILESSEKLALIIDPEKLNKAQRAKYNLLQVKIGMKMHVNVNDSDSLLSSSILYYKNINDTALLYECFYLLASRKHVKENYNASLKILDKSEKLLPFFDTHTDYLYNATLRIKNLLKLEQFQEAEHIAKTLLQYVQKNGEKRDIMRGFVVLAEAVRYNNKTIEYEQNLLKALQLAKEIDDNRSQRGILNNLSKLMENLAMYDMALEYLKQIENIRINRDEIPKKNLIKSMIFHKQNELDSAYYYASVASQGSDNFIASVATSYMSEWLANEGDFVNAYNKKQTAIKIAEDIEYKLHSKKREEEFKKKELENEANLSKIEQEKKTLLFISIIFILLLTIVVIYLFFYKKQRKQYEIYLKSKSVQLEQDNLLLNQSKEISLLREKESLLRESLFRRIDVLKKIPSITPSETDNKSSKITLTEKDWNELVQTIDDSYPTFTHRLKETFPLLTIADIYFCCFLKINVNLQDLSDIYCVSKSAITKKKYRIKTDKLCIADNFVSLDDFLKKF